MKQKALRTTATARERAPAERSLRMSLARVAIVVLGALTNTLLPLIASADTKTIDISTGLPSEDMPLGSSFVLTVKPSDTTTNVHAVFVEYADGWFGSKDGSEFKTCGAIQKTVHVDPKLLRSQAPGPITFSKIYEDPSADPTLKDPTAKDLVLEFGKRPAYLLAPPPRDKNGLARDSNGLVKLAVPSTSFFKHGAHYCLFVEEDQPDTRIQGFLKSLIDCKPGAACEPLAAEKIKLFTVDEKQVLFALGVDEVTISSALDPAPPKLNYFKADFSDLGISTGSFDFVVPSPTLTKIDEADGKKRNAKVSPTLRIRTTPMDKVLVSLLVQDGTKVKAVTSGDVVDSAQPQKVLSTIHVDMSKEGIALAGDFDSVQNINGVPARTGEHETLKLGLARDLKLASDSAWMAEGLLRLGSATVATTEVLGPAEKKLPDDLDSTVKAIRANLSDAPLPPLIKRLTSLSERADDLYVHLLSASGSLSRSTPLCLLPTSSAFPPASAMDQNVKAALTDWANQFGTKVAGARGPGLADVTTNLSCQAGELAAHLQKLADDEHKMADLLLIMVGGAAIDVSIGLNPQTWFFSYVTPTVGYVGTFDKFGNSFGVATVSLEISPFANSTDEPMWTNGAKDLRRLFTLELGVAPQAGSFGPDQRYSGPGGSVPPLLLGTGIHLIPYTVLSTGCMFISAKQSALTNETPVFRVAGYFGASVEANVPDIVLNLIKGKKTSGE